MNICQRLREDLQAIEHYLDVDADNLVLSKLMLDDLRKAELNILQSRITLKALCPTSINKLEII